MTRTGTGGRYLAKKRAVLPEVAMTMIAGAFRSKHISTHAAATPSFSPAAIDSAPGCLSPAHQVDLRRAVPCTMRSLIVPSLAPWQALSQLL